jgi:hypothetical protein
MQEVKFFMMELEERNKHWSYVENLEKHINAWLKVNPHVKIINRETSVTAAAVSSRKEKADLLPNVFILVTVWYEGQENVEAIGKV